MLRRILFIHRGSSEQSGFPTNLGGLMKESKCIGTNLTLQISRGFPVRMKHPGVARFPSTQWVHWCAELTHTKIQCLKEIFTLLLQCHFPVFPCLPLRFYLYYSFPKLLIFLSFQGSCPVLVEAHTCIYWDFKCCSACIWAEKKKYTMFSNKRGDSIYLPQFSHHL